MSTFFVDSSALAKRYLVEVGSAWVISWIEPVAGNIIIVSELALTEVQSLLARRVRDGTLSTTAATSLRNDFLLHYSSDYLVVPIETPIFQAAGKLVNSHKLRTLDAIQLASAIHAHQILAEPMTFISADTNLLIAAVAEGFATDDPHLHP